MVTGMPDPVTGLPDPLQEEAAAWLAEDPDPVSRDELRGLLDRWPASREELADRFAASLRFGTAGLRGPLRAGPNGMNPATVRRATAGLVAWLADRGADGPLVVGYDGRHRSAEFAAEIARVATGAGRPALVLPRPLPTPVLAYAVRHLRAAAGVMVTASHNPPGDNGYKVYLGAALGGPTGAGAQIAPPTDREIEAAIDAVGPLSQVATGEPGTVLGDEPVDAYVKAAAAVVAPDTPRALTVAYTPLHGVGRTVTVAALAAAGFDPPVVVAEQADPDPDFPTTPFPNPEEPGALDRLLATAAAAGADLAVAHDPDADRCAVAVPGPDGWRRLHGDELGVLLADHLMRRGVHGRYVTTLVSSSMLGALCAARGVPYTETLTGFKWIVRAGPDLAYGYEEALGYAVAPDLVRDKDGITAALLVCEMAAQLVAAGSSLRQRLDELAAEAGVHLTDQVSVRFARPAQVAELMARVRRRPPSTLAGVPVSQVDEPAADLLVLRADGRRVAVRPSGTEPKLKVYLEVVEQPAGPGGVAQARQRAAATLAVLRDEVAARLADR